MKLDKPKTEVRWIESADTKKTKPTMHNAGEYASTVETLKREEAAIQQFKADISRSEAKLHQERKR